MMTVRRHNYLMFLRSIAPCSRPFDDRYSQIGREHIVVVETPIGCLTCGASIYNSKPNGRITFNIKP